MIYLRRLLSKLRGLFRNARVEEEIEREIAAHLGLLEDDFLRKGMSAEEAHLAARRAYGGVEQAKQLHRDERSILWLERLRQDVRYGFRQLGKSPGFTVLAIITFALGIGANTAIFSLADLIIRRPVSLPGLDRLVSMEEQSSTGEDKGISAANYLDLLAANHTFEQLAVYEYWSAGVGAQDQPYEAIGVKVSANFFSTVGIKPATGRDFIAGEDAEGRDHEVILSSAFWRRRFAADPSAVGKLLKLDGEMYTVIGVMPPRAIFPLGAPAFWVPIAMSQQMRSERRQLSLHGVGRLQTGVSLEQARGGIDGIWNSLAKSYPRANANRSLLIVGLRDSIVLDYNRQFALLLMGVVGFVLLIACTNIATLQFARASGRQHEIAIRAALGASRRRVLSQLLTESILLSLLGGAAGSILSIASVRLLRNTLPTDVQWFCDVSNLKVNGAAFAFAVLLAIVSGVLSGLAPAWKYSKANPTRALATESHRIAGSSNHRWHSAFVTTEIALALVLLIGAMLMVKGFATLVTGQRGLEPESLLTFHVDLPQSRPPQQVRAFQDNLLSQLSKLQGIRSVALASGIPYSSYEDSTALTLEENAATPRDQAPAAMAESVSPDYFRTLHIPLREGRWFDVGDTPDTLHVAVVSESMVQRLWSGQSAIGKRLKSEDFDNVAPWLTVVGVVGDIQHEIYDRSFRSILYVPYQQAPPHSLDFVIRGDSDPVQLAPTVRRIIRSLDSNLPVENLETLGGLISSQASALQYVSLLVAGFGFLALLLSAVGVYALMANSVAERRREIGIRMALGAQKWNVLQTLMRRALVATGVGLSCGIVLALAFTRLLSSLIYGVSAWDTETFVVIPVVLALVALTATYIPAHRSTSIDPMQTLRMD
ncbi:MAG: ABC transporter permease [Candidatus Sulfotelmatobacter sp.]